MPFDALVSDQVRFHERTLADNIRLLGFEPIPHEDAVAHMEAEAARYPADFFYPAKRRYNAGLWRAGAFAGGAICVLAGINSTFGGFPPITGIIAGIVICGIIAASWYTGLFRLRARGPAHWEDMALVVGEMDWIRVPDEIIRVAYRVKRDDSTVRFTMSKLYRDEVSVPDPVLWAHKGDETVCLGIWDDKRIIRVAQRV